LAKYKIKNRPGNKFGRETQKIWQNQAACGKVSSKRHERGTIKKWIVFFLFAKYKIKNRTGKRKKKEKQR